MGRRDRTLPDHDRKKSRFESHFELFRQLAGHLLEGPVREHELHHALVVVGFSSCGRFRAVELPEPANGLEIEK